MEEYVVAHFHNAAPECEARLTAAFSGQHRASVQRLRGFFQMQRFVLGEQQLMADIAQPWKFLTLYEFHLDRPELHLPALATPIADLRDAGLIAADGTERIYSYRIYAPWKYSANFQPDRPLSHMMLLLANVVPGREAEYHQWYDEVHSVEVSNSPGYIGMKRGGLAEVQVPPVRYCPGDQLILGGMQSDNLGDTLGEFFARAMGTSPSGVAWGPRSKAASTARTVHIFKSIQGPFAADQGA